MDALRSAAREYLKKADRENSPEFDPDGVALPDGLDTLSRDILDCDLTSHQEVRPAIQLLSSVNDVANGAF